MCSNLGFHFLRLFAKMQARLLSEDMRPTFVSDFSGFHHGSGSMRGTVHAERKGRWELRPESLKVSSLESCVKVWGVWEGGWRGQKGTGL